MGEDRRIVEGVRMNTEDLMKDIDPTDEAFSTLARLLAMMRMSSYIFAGYAMVQGILIIIGGASRFSAEAYYVAMLLPSAPASWGWALLVFGIAAFVGVKNRMYKIASLGMFAAGSWSMGFAIAFLVSSIQDPSANLTAFPVYTKDAVLFLLLFSGLRLMAHAQATTEISDA